jgi:hypothetical protein
MSRVILRVMLSLLLLLTQQMALTHDLSHWSAPAASVAGGADQQDAADDGQCAQCVLFAELECGPGTDLCSLWLAEAAPSMAAATPLSAACARTVCGFLSRAPPLA